MRDREKRCSECLQLQKEEMESPYVCDECLEEHQVDFMMEADRQQLERLHDLYTYDEGGFSDGFTN